MVILFFSMHLGSSALFCLYILKCFSLIGFYLEISFIPFPSRSPSQGSPCKAMLGLWLLGVCVGGKPKSCMFLTLATLNRGLCSQNNPFIHYCESYVRQSVSKCFVCKISFCIIIDCLGVCFSPKAHRIFGNVQDSISTTLLYLPHTEDRVLTDMFLHFLTKHCSGAKVTAA